MKVCEAFGVRPVKGDFGLEVEVEGNHLTAHHPNLFKFERDGSLNDGVELVLSKPMPEASLPKVMKELDTYYHNATVIPSVRTGVHIHINVSDLDIKQLSCFISLYYMVEPVLLELCGESRSSNLFCLPAYQAEVQVHRLHQFLQTGRREYFDDNVRYSGLNLTALNKYGSVEFRALRTPCHKGLPIIGSMVSTLMSLKKLAQSYDSPQDIVRGYSEAEKDVLLRELLPHVYNEAKDVPDVWAKLKKGMRVAQDVTISYNTGVYGKEPVKEEFEGKGVDLANLRPDIPPNVVEAVRKMPNFNFADLNMAWERHIQKKRGE